MAENIIELVDLVKKYGEHTVVDHLNLTIRKGEIFGLLGPNGAGKSTTILMLLGLTEPTSGSIRVCGINSTYNPIEVKRRTGYLPEDVGFYGDLTGLENLIYTGRLNRLSTKDAAGKAEELLHRVGLSDARNKKAGTYSRGMRQRLGFADVLIKNPDVIILDEPTLGIDPNGVREFLDMIVQLSREEGLTVLLSSHHLHQIQKICDRVGLFVNGKLLAEGNIQALSQKLFSNEPLLVDVGVSGEATGRKRSDNDKLQDTLRTIDGVININCDNGVYHIGCSRDVTSEIAKTVVASGTGLNFLNKKEYGLDEIYQRYFEGGKDHE